MPANTGTRILRVALIALVVALAPAPGRSLAAESSAPGTIEVTVGESLQDLQSALKINQTPSEISSASGHETQLRLPERGLWIFFDSDNRVTQYRFDAPFAGSIHGVKVGDSMAQAQVALGPPAYPVRTVALGQAFVYQQDNGLTIRCDFDSSGKLQTIRVLGGTIMFSEPHAAGRVLNLAIAGNLAVAHDLDCTTLDRVAASDIPPDLYAAIPRCLAANRYEDAVMLFALAGTEASFDAMRVTDKTAGQARQVMIMNTFNTLPEEQRQKFNDTMKALTSNPQSLSDLCARVSKFAPPAYYPRYMILHGIKAFSGDPYANALDPNFDARSAWVQVQRTYLNCTSAH
jgi:hypothetical protein